MLFKRRLHIAPCAILTSKMVRVMAEFPYESLSIAYKRYGCGIVAGLDLIKDNGDIYLTEGIVKAKDSSLYFLKDRMNLSKFWQQEKLREGSPICPPRGQIVRIVLKKGTTQQDGGVTTDCLVLTILTDAEAETIEIGRISDEGDLKLPNVSAMSDPKKQYEELTRRSHLNLLSSPYSSSSGQSFHPFIFQSVLHFLMKKKEKTAFDIALMIELENHGTVSDRTLQFYINAVGESIPDGEGRETLLKQFFQALSHKEKMLTSYAQPIVQKHPAKSEREGPLV